VKQKWCNYHAAKSSNWRADLRRPRFCSVVLLADQVMSLVSRKLALWIAVGCVAAVPVYAFAQTEPAAVVAQDVKGVMTKGRIDAVTVYRGQAMVTRAIDVGAGELGLREIVVTDLPSRVLPTSLFAESDPGVQVRSVLYRERAVQDDIREGVKDIDAQLATLTQSLTQADRDRQVLQQNLDYLTKLEAFTATTATTELSKGVLNADTLQKLTDFIFSKRGELSKQSLEGDAKRGELQKQIELLSRKRAEIAQGASRTAREAVLVLDVQRAGAGVRLNYLVDQAGWSPSYTVNATTGKEELTVLYQAGITQMSGEDWAGVKMTLSTATPSVVARAPKLEPLALALMREQPVSEPARADADELRRLRENRRDALNNYNTLSNNTVSAAQSGGKLFDDQSRAYFAQAQRENEKVGNQVASESQMFELKAKDVAAARAVSRVETETITVTYKLQDRTSLPSRADQQFVSITSLPMKGEFYKVAVPVLTPYVYNEASVRNASQQVLLAGPTASYLDGEFVGHGDLPTVAIGESFTAGFGIDHSLRASRELLSKSDKQQGGNTVATFDYALKVENFGPGVAKVRLTDRVPMIDGSQLKPTVTSTSVEPSKDADYQAGPAKKGILRFDLDVPAQSIGTKASEVKYTLTLEYDRQMTITGR
jgi:hypothetical protein